MLKSLAIVFRTPPTWVIKDMPAGKDAFTFRTFATTLSQLHTVGLWYLPSLIFLYFTWSQAGTPFRINSYKSDFLQDESCLPNTSYHSHKSARTELQLQANIWPHKQSTSACHRWATDCNFIQLLKTCESTNKKKKNHNMCSTCPLKSLKKYISADTWTLWIITMRSRRPFL